MHKSQILLYLVLAFITGITAGSFGTLSQIGILVLVVSGVSAVTIFWRRRWLGVVIGFSLVSFAFGITKINIARSEQSVLTQLTDHKVSLLLRGYVAKEPETSGGNQKIVLRVKDVIVPKYRIKTNEDVLIIQKAFPRYDYGDILSIRGEIESPKIDEETGFDYKSYLAKDGIFTTMFYPQIEVGDSEISSIDSTKIFLFSKIFKIKNSFKNSVERSITEPNASFINGILLGSRTEIPQDLKDSFARTGMTHILAISGYNIAIIAEVVSFILLIFLKRPTAFWLAVLAIVIFTILTGAQASVVRAAIMGMLVLLARREGRLYGAQNAIVLVAGIMLFINPLALRYDIGFQLSFLATIGLVFLSPKIEKYFESWPNHFRFKETMIMTLSAQIFVLPLILYHFGNLSITSLPANLLVLPTIPYAMLLGFISGILGMTVPFFGEFVGYFAWFITSIELWIVQSLAAHSWATIAVSFNWVMLVIAYILLLLFLFDRRIFTRTINRIKNRF